MFSPRFSNRILSRLPQSDYDLLQPDLIRMELPLRFVLGNAGTPLNGLYFITSGIASVVTNTRSDPPIEVGVIGFEGVANLPLVMGCDRSPNDIFMQIAGSGAFISAAALKSGMGQSASLRAALLKYANAFMAQTSSTILANGQGHIPQRLCRWLLMADDRIEGDELHLTHEFLSIMLGIRRASVSTALQALSRSGGVRTKRGGVVITDRALLLDLANGYYGVAEEEYDRIFD